MQMNSLAKYDDDSSSRLDLEGLEPLLTEGATHSESSHSVKPNEIFELLDEISQLKEVVGRTNERLTATHKRFTGISTLFEIQSKQIEKLTHYQAEAAKVGVLEKELAAALAENQKLKGGFCYKLGSIFSSFMKFKLF